MLEVELVEELELELEQELEVELEYDQEVCAWDDVVVTEGVELE